MKLSELFTDESKWVKGMFHGFRSNPTDQPRPTITIHANCHCLMGGARICVADREPFQDRIRLAIAKLFPDRTQSDGSVSIAAFNDDDRTTFADVQAVIKEIEKEYACSQST